MFKILNLKLAVQIHITCGLPVANFEKTRILYNWVYELYTSFNFDSHEQHLPIITEFVKTHLQEISREKCLTVRVFTSNTQYPLYLSSTVRHVVMSRYTVTGLETRSQVRKQTTLNL